jgi:hypothetical protein
MYSALGPVGEAIYGVLLQDPELVAHAPGRIYDDLPQNPEYPCVSYEVSAIEHRGLGGGSLPEVELRTHVFSVYGGLTEAREIDRLIIGLLRDTAIPIDPTLYATCGRVFWDTTTPLPPVERNGVLVHELVSIFRIYVEEPQP